MKKVIIASGIFLFMVVICVYNIRVINETSKKSTSYINKMNDLNSDYSHEELTRVCEEFENYWDKRSKILSTLGHHDLLDQIKGEFAKLSSAIKLKQRSKILACVEKFKFLFDTLETSSHPSIEQIF